MTAQQPGDSAASAQPVRGVEGPHGPRFLKGVAVSVWQNCADNDSNWTRYAKSRWPFKNFGVSTIRGKYNIIDKHTEFWDRFREDIKLTADLGSTSFRISIEWARIEPQKGVIDEAAVKRYHEILDCCDEYGLEVNATLWHFVHPTWFDDLGGFTKEENIPHFVEWSKTAFRLFGKRIKLWATFNEPSCAMFLGFVVGIAPPGRIMDLVGAGKFLSTMLQAHTEAYHAIKALPGGSDALVGLVSHHISFEAQGNGLLHYVADMVAGWMTYWWGWDIIDHWMMTGEFVYKLPVVGEWMRWKDPRGKPPCDWWGINYYSRGIFSWCLLPSCHHSEIMTDMYYPIYPEGMYNCLKRCNRYGIPMYITETGIADAKDDRRSIMIDAYFKEVLRAMADGCDVRGFYYWTLVDNCEWATGYTMKFGLYAWEPDGSVDRKLKEGSKTLIRYFKTLPDDCAGVTEVARRARAVLGQDMGVEEELEKEGFKPATATAAAGAKKGVGVYALG